MNDALRDTLDALDGVRECGSGHVALCPAHDDTNASLTVDAGDRVPVVLTCHAGCTQDDVLHALRGRMNGHTPISNGKPSTDWNPWRDGREVDAYPYHDASGDVLFEVVRFEVKPEHPAYPDKTFLQRTPGGWGRDGIEPPLYHLPDVLAAADEGRVVFIVEGEKDVATLHEAGLTATTCLQGAGEWKDRYADNLDGAQVVVLPDNDDAGTGHAEDVAASCHGKAASVRILRLPDLPKKGDVSDWLEAGHDAEELKDLARETSEYEPPQPTQEIAEAEKAEAAVKDDRTQAEVLLDVAAGVKLFHTPKGKAYATFSAGGKGEAVSQTAPVGSSAFADFLRHGFYAERRKSPSAQALTDAKDTLRAKARFDGEKKEVHLRVAERGGCIFVDLCNDAWEAVKITAGGWQVVTDPPVKFRRVQGMKALPKPQEGGTLNLLRKHVRLSGEGFTLLLGYLVQSVRPVGPYPILELTGEQGSGKSTAAKMIRALVDPSHIPIRTRPRKERDLVIAAENAWALAFDNMSGVKPWLSDALCRLSTGGGFGTRKLYADREEEIFYARRPMILNGINRLAGRSDLADRAIRLELEAIPEGERRTEKDVWKRFNRDRPKIIGALFGAVSTALRREPSVELDRLPRMADFARWAVAAEPAFGSDLNTNGSGESAFLNAYEENRAEASESAVESDTVASAIRALLNDAGEWEGKTTGLMEDLKPYLPDPKDPPKDFPTSHQAMTARLKRVMPDLRAVGIDRVDGLGPQGRRFQITARQAPESPEQRSNHATDAANSGSALRRSDSAPEAQRSTAGGTGKRRSSTGVEKRSSRPTNADYSGAPATPAVNGHESKDAASARSSDTLGQDEWETIPE